MLKEIELLFIPVHFWDVCIYIVIFWYHKYIHQVIIGEMMFCCLQFGNITNKILQDVLLFGVSVVFSLTIIGNKMSDRAKLCFKIIIYQIIGLRELPRFLVIFCHYNFFLADLTHATGVLSINYFNNVYAVVCLVSMLIILFT